MKMDLEDISGIAIKWFSGFLICGFCVAIGFLVGSDGGALLGVCVGLGVAFIFCSAFVLKALINAEMPNTAVLASASIVVLGSVTIGVGIFFGS